MFKKNTPKIAVCICFWFLSVAVAWGQVWRGKVSDAANGEALPAAALRAGQASTYTNAQGAFEIAARPGDTLRVQMLGYEALALVLSAEKPFLNLLLQANSLYLNEVVVAALQADTKIMQVPGAVALLTPRELQRDNDSQLMPALNRIPGLYAHTGTLTTNRLTIRGIGSRSLFGTNKVRAYLNDIPLTTGDGETTIEDIDMGLIGQVEVIKGPSSSVYGAGLGGTLLLAARKAPFGQTSVSSEAMTGSFGLWRQVNRLASGSGTANLQVMHSQMNNEGYRDNNQYRRQSLAALGQFQAGEKSTVTVLANFISAKAFIPSAIDSITFVQNPRAAAPTWAQLRGYEDYRKMLIGVSVQHRFGAVLENISSVFGTFRIADEPRPFNFLREQSQAWGVRSRWIYAPAQGWAGRQKLRLVAGGEFFDEWYGWRTYRNQNGQSGAALSDNLEHRSYYNLFAQGEVALAARTTLTAGLNLNSTTYQLTDLFPTDNVNLGGKRAFAPLFSPRLALSHALGENSALYATASHGFSPPTLSETLTPTGQINPDIRPETGMNYEAGWRGAALGKRLQYDVAAYLMPIRNLLVARRTADDAFVGVNAGKTQHAGLELSGHYLAWHGQGPQAANLLRLWGTASLAHYRFEEFVDGPANYSGKQLTGTPPHTVNLGADLELRGGLYANLNYLYVAAYPVRDDNTLYTQAYGVANAKAGFRRQWGAWRLHLYGGVANIADARYASMILVNATGRPPRYYYPGLPRNYFAGLEVAWQFSR